MGIGHLTFAWYDGGMSVVSEWHPPRPYCLPGCDRLDGHDGRDAGACMTAGEVLTPGPLDLVHRHPDIPVVIPMRNASEPS